MNENIQLNNINIVNWVRN